MAWTSSKQFRELWFFEKLFGVSDGGEWRLSQGVERSDLGFLHDGLAQGANEHQLGRREPGMLANPFVKSPRDGFFAGRKGGHVEDVAEEVGEAGLGLVVGFAKPLLGDEEIWTPKRGGNGFDVFGGEFFSPLETLKRGIVAHEIFDEGFDLGTVCVGKCALA